MANAIFTTKVSPVYDDIPEIRYHFPKTYLSQVERAVGDWILYYEPRRESSDLSGRSGRQCYFATARVDRIESDPRIKDHFYAYIVNYLSFSYPVPFREGDRFYETSLRKDDGSTNKGRFGRAVRLLNPEDYAAILERGFSDSMPPIIHNEQIGASQEDEVQKVVQDRRMLVVARPFRDAAFARLIQAAYDNTCSMTGLRLINGGGRCEIEAAHILPVAESGPDSPRNGIALSRTVHWMFDRHFISISDSWDILVAEKYVPEPVQRLLNPDRKIRLPHSPSLRPHPVFLKHHRSRFKGA